MVGEEDGEGGEGDDHFLEARPGVGEGGVDDVWKEDGGEGEEGGEEEECRRGVCNVTAKKRGKGESAPFVYEGKGEGWAWDRPKPR